MASSEAASTAFAKPLEACANDRPRSLAGPGSVAISRAPWVGLVESAHFSIVCAATLLIALASPLVSLSDGLELTLLVVAVSFFGLPHGALDYLLGKQVFAPRFGRAWPLPFSLVYLSLAGAVVAGWLIVPFASLVFFLVIAAGHFGIGDVQLERSLGSETRFAALGAAVEAAARGALIFVALLHAHPNEAALLFSYLLPASAADIQASIVALSPRLVVVTGALVAVILAHHLGGWAQGLVGHGRLATEIFALTLLFLLAPPVVAFVTYFCFWHSFRHALWQAAQLDDASPGRAFRAFIRHAWPTTVAAIAIGAGSYAVIGTDAPAAALVQVVFIGLSALTVPHILFTVLAERAS